VVRAAASRTFCTAGKSKPIKTAMIAITTNNSIRVKPDFFCFISRANIKPILSKKESKKEMKKMNKMIKPYNYVSYDKDMSAVNNNKIKTSK
jgi:hypothetical protein